MDQRQLRRKLPQHGHRRRLIVHVDAALAAGADLAPQQNLVALGIDPVLLEDLFGTWRGLKDAAQHGLLRAEAHHIAGGLAPQQQHQCVDQNRLARTGLAGQQVQPRPKDGDRMVDHSVIFCAELQQHGSVSRREHSREAKE